MSQIASPYRSSLPAGAPPLASVEAELTFIRPQDTKPYFHSSALTGGEPKVFFETERHRVAIADMRPLADALSVDREGFELLDHRTAVGDLYDDDVVKGAYYAETEALLQERFRARRVVIFDATRRADGGAGAANPDGLRGPATRVHVDYTVKSGPQRTRDILGEDEAARIAEAGSRVLQINVWRPIRGPVERAPLALADASSVRPDSLVATDQIFPDRVGEIYNVAWDPEQRWYYAPRMDRDEILLIKGWDSDAGRARFTPHGAFELPDTPVSAPPRESIELRTLIVVD